MRKIIKKWAESNVILLSSEDMKVYGLKAGDILEIEIKKLEKNKKD